MAVTFAAEAAARLAYYKAENGHGVLGPRGWYCFGVYGSNGDGLYVSPDPIGSAEVIFARDWKGFAGPVIQLSFDYGDTSGRFAVAKTMARVFTSHREFVQQVIDEGIVPASEFPSGPYPKDKLSYKSSGLVEYETPAGAAGLGTQSKLIPDAEPIRGMAILRGETPDLEYLAVRLPANTADLASVIIQGLEQDIGNAEQKK